MRDYPIIVTDRDICRLRGLLGGESRAMIRDHGHLGQLESELERALVLAADEMPAGVVTIGSLVRVLDLDTGKRRVITLVLPSEADTAERRISVLAPIGAALLGLRAGDDVECGTPDDVRRLHIEHVVQPDQLVATQRVRPILRESYGPHGAH